METQTNRIQYALVTGASRGIGRAIAIELARDGYYVLINYKDNHQAALETLNIIHQEGGHAELLPFNVSNPEDIKKALDEWFDRHSDSYIDVLVNNAGYIDNELLLWMTPAQWHGVVDVNLNAFFYISQRVLEGMVVNHHGRIVSVSSLLGQQGIGGTVNYAAAKAALIGATKALANEMATKNITVNAVAPGFIETELIETNTMLTAAKKMIPMRRYGKPEEVAYLVSFLCSNKANYISGQTIGINGALL